MRRGRHNLRSASALMLGLWVLALFVAVANACLPGQPIEGHPVGHQTSAADHVDATASADCSKLCNDGVPLFAKLQLVEDLPAVQAFLVATPLSLDPVVLGVHASPAHLARPPADVPVYLRSLRLTL